MNFEEAIQTFDTTLAYAHPSLPRRVVCDTPHKQSVPTLLLLMIDYDAPVIDADNSICQRDIVLLMIG